MSEGCFGEPKHRYFVCRKEAAPILTLTFARCEEGKKEIHVALVVVCHISFCTILKMFKDTFCLVDTTQQLQHNMGMFS